MMFIHNNLYWYDHLELMLKYGMGNVRNQLRQHISAMPMAYMSNEHHGQFNGCNASASSKGDPNKKIKSTCIRELSYQVV